MSGTGSDPSDQIRVLEARVTTLEELAIIVRDQFAVYNQSFDRLEGAVKTLSAKIETLELNTVVSGHLFKTLDASIEDVEIGIRGLRNEMRKG